MSTETDLFFGFYRAQILPCLTENVLNTPFNFVNVTAPYFVAFGAIDHLSSIRDFLLHGRGQQNNLSIKSFFEDTNIWGMGHQISLRKLYIDMVNADSRESDLTKKRHWTKAIDSLNQHWQLSSHLEDALVSLEPDCSYDDFVSVVRSESLKIKNYENYKYSHFLYKLRCDLMHENRPSDQDALFLREETLPRYTNGTNEHGLPTVWLAFPPRLLHSIVENAIRFLETACDSQGINPYDVKPFSGLSPEERKKITLDI